MERDPCQKHREAKGDDGGEHARGLPEDTFGGAHDRAVEQVEPEGNRPQAAEPGDLSQAAEAGWGEGQREEQHQRAQAERVEPGPGVETLGQFQAQRGANAGDVQDEQGNGNDVEGGIVCQALQAGPVTAVELGDQAADQEDEGVGDQGLGLGNEAAPEEGRRQRNRDGQGPVGERGAAPGGQQQPECDEERVELGLDGDGPELERGLDEEGCRQEFSVGEMVAEAGGECREKKRKRQDRPVKRQDAGDAGGQEAGDPGAGGRLVGIEVDHQEATEKKEQLHAHLPEPVPQPVWK